MTLLPLRCRVDSDCRHSFPEGSNGEGARDRHEKDHRDWFKIRVRFRAGSSAAEQGTFNPRDAGSSPAPLTGEIPA